MSIVFAAQFRMGAGAEQIRQFSGQQVHWLPLAHMGIHQREDFFRTPVLPVKPCHLRLFFA
jgi:hypothetical protein